MTPLKQKILDLIRKEGPIGVAQYMHIALMDPEHGYYMRGDPLGAAGDFITAPEVSQLFGEMIGLFLVQAWEDRGRPKRFHLAELGPGRGTLMADILRTARLRPAFCEAAVVSLIEASPALRAIQRQTLNGARVDWVEGIDALDDAPLYVVANEFLDALPVHPFIRSTEGWRARMVGAQDGTLIFATGEAVAGDTFPGHANASVGDVVEVNTEAVAAMRTMSHRIAHSGGVGLIVDYGHAESGLGDTFQAVKRHAYTDPLAEPGEADLTFHVNFAALSTAAQGESARVFGPVTQGAFLAALGIHVRAERLKQSAPASAADVDAAVARLTQPAAMGTLFKVMGLAAPGSPSLPGFPC